MNYRVVKLKKLAAFLVSGSFSLFLASSTLAQRNPTGPPPGAGPPPNNNPNLDDRARQVDEGRLRSAEADAGREEKNQKRSVTTHAAIVSNRSVCLTGDYALWGKCYTPLGMGSRSTSSIKRDVKKKLRPRPETRSFLEIQPTVIRLPWGSSTCAHSDHCARES